MNKSRKKYIIVFIITLGIFVAVFLLVNFLDAGKRENIAELQQKITVDLIANETQFDLLKNAPCNAIAEGSILSRQMGDLGRKLVYAEETQGGSNKDVLELKKYYSLLEVKDYLLSQEIAKKCDIQIESIVYFYEDACNECKNQGYVLTELKRKYPWLRIYSFDLDLDFSIVKTFAGLYNISERAPIIIINGNKYSGFKTVEEIETYIPELVIKKEQKKIEDQALVFLNKKENFLGAEFTFVSFVNNELTYSYIAPSDDRDDSEELRKEVVLIYSPEDNNFIIKNN